MVPSISKTTAAGRRRPGPSSGSPPPSRAFLVACSSAAAWPLVGGWGAGGLPASRPRLRMRTAASNRYS
jgi:hypothetical protein